MAAGAFSSKRLLPTLCWIGIYGGLAIPLIAVPLVHHPFVFPKAVFLHLLVSLTFPAYLVLAWQEPAYRPRKTPLLLAILFQLLALLLSTVFSPAAHRSFWGSQARMNGLFSAIHFAAWAIMASSVVTTFEQWKKLIGVQIGVGCVSAIIALLQIPFPSAASLGLQTSINRVMGWAGNPIFLSNYLIFIFFWIGFLWLPSNANSRKQSSGNRNKALLAAAIIAAALVASSSRGPILGLLLGLGTAGIAFAAMNRRWKPLVILFGIAIPSAAAYVLIRMYLVNLPSLAGFWKSNEFLAHLFSSRPDDRISLWKVAWAAFLERPILGWGPNNYDLAFVTNFLPNLCLWFYEDHPHSHFFEILSNTGVIGFLSEIFVWVTLFGAAMASRKLHRFSFAKTAIILGMLTAHLAQLQTSLYTPPTSLMFFFLCAFLIASSGSKFANQKQENIERHDLRAKHWLAFGALEAGACASVVLFSAVQVLGSYQQAQAIRSLSQGSYDQMALRMKNALPNSQLYREEWLTNASLLLMKMASLRILDRWPGWKQTVNWIEPRANVILDDPGARARIGPLYSRMLFHVGRVANYSQIIQEAGRHMKLNIEQAPKKQSCLVEYARWLAETGKAKEGTEHIERALSLDPESGYSWWQSGLYHWRNLKDARTGTDHMLKAIKYVRCKHDPDNAGELVQEAQLFAYLKDKEGFKKRVLPRMSENPNMEASDLLIISKTCEQLGLLAERNQYLLQAATRNPSYKTRFASLFAGKATTIAEAETNSAQDASRSSNSNVSGASGVENR